MSALTFPVQTERLTLRTYRASDAEALLAIYQLPQVATYLLDDPWTTELATTRVGERIPRTGLDGPTGSLSLIMELGGEVIGDVAIWLTDKERGVAEIGWVLSPHHAGRGYASEAVRWVLAAAFDHHELHRVVAQMDARNDASARLAGNVGMVREAHMRQDWWVKGEWTDTVVFGMLESDRANSVA